MPLANTADRYGSVARFFHWLVALLILAAIGLSFLMPEGPISGPEEAAWAQTVFSIHKTVGVAAFFAALLRILWALVQPKPGLLHPDRRLESFAAEAVHWTLYGAMVIMPLSGWIYHSTTTGFAPILWPFGQHLPLVPQSESLGHAAIAVHKISATLLYVVIGLHVLGALKHAVVDRDATLARMLRGTAVPVPRQHRSALPVLVALVVWLGVLAAGALSGPEREETPAPTATASAPAVPAAPAPAPTASTPAATSAPAWTVTDGALTIAIVQMGSEVKGSFKDWTATIHYDETAKTGDVTVTIPISGLDLGATTSQALGADFFDAATHPAATFTGTIAETDGHLAATGTLDLKGVTLPLTLPFTLRLNGDTATVDGSTTVDRRDFGIGSAYKDEKTVGFQVRIDVALIAQRG